ncbi:MAG TPA: DOMON-like domain-containing protein [Candidatus Binatia bacterium]|nr:DOMON-like domain-containing protein [Candidatus Binatia bacterium]
MPYTPDISARTVLACSKNMPNPIVREIEVTLAWSEAHALVVTYRLSADTRQLCIPDSAGSRRVNGLWQHTCFEVFVRVKDSPAYYEFNFSPSGEWAAYGFRAYRDGGPLDDAVGAPDISVQTFPDQLKLAAAIRLAQFLSVQPGMLLRLGLSAVVEASDGTLSYWALNHPAAKPDFHHPDSFALVLAVPDAKA